MNRQAQKLLTKFHDTSIYRMARGNAKDAPTQPLFHYTTEQALCSIIRSETFWFTSIYYMDDEAELSFGFSISHASLSAAMKREDVATKRFLKPLVDDFKFEKIKQRVEFYSASPTARDVDGRAMAVSPDQRRALKLLAGSPDGCTMSIMLAHGLKPELLADLVRGDLATTKPETVRTGGNSIEIVRMTITDAGRLAIDGR